MLPSDRGDRGALVALGLILAAIVLVAGMTIYGPKADGGDGPANHAEAQQNGQGDVSQSVASPDRLDPWQDKIDQWIAAVATLGATGVSIAALIWLRKTWKETQRTADAAFQAVAAAQESNAIASDTAKRQLRAYLAIDHIDPQRFIAGQTPLFGIIIKNTGATPAKQFKHAVFLSAHQKDTVRKYRTEEGETRSSSSVDIGAGSPYVMIASSDTVVSPGLFQEVKDKTWTFEIAAYASYSDVFNKRHRLIFRAFVDMTHGAVNVLAADKHNVSN